MTAADAIALSLTRMELDAVIESLSYSLSAIRDARETPVEVRAWNVADRERLIAKLRTARASAVV